MTKPILILDLGSTTVRAFVISSTTFEILGSAKHEVKCGVWNIVYVNCDDEFDPWDFRVGLKCEKLRKYKEFVHICWNVFIEDKHCVFSQKLC